MEANMFDWGDSVMTEKQNKMANMPMGKLVASMSLPLMISLLVQSLYNIVDSIFVARLGEEALTATSLAFPVQMLMIAFSVGTSVGVNALLSRMLGAGSREKATQIANTGMVLSLAASLFFLLLVCSFQDSWWDYLLQRKAQRCFAGHT